MAEEKLEQAAMRLSIADISSAVALGLQRALDSRGGAAALQDKILIYGGRLDFNIQVLPQNAIGSVKEMVNVGKS